MTQRWHCLHMSLLSAELVSSSSGNCIRSRHCSTAISEAAKMLVNAFISGRLDYCNFLFSEVSYYLMRKVSVSTEHRCTPRYRFKTVRSHHSSISPASLATSPPSSPVQGWVLTIRHCQDKRHRGISMTTLFISCLKVVVGVRQDVRCSRRQHFGDRSFAAAPAHSSGTFYSTSFFTAHICSYSRFKRRMKTFCLFFCNYVAHKRYTDSEFDKTYLLFLLLDINIFITESK